MLRTGSTILACSALLGMFAGAACQDQMEISLTQFEPEHYRYDQAQSCVNCHQGTNDIMTRAVGVDISASSPRLEESGWLASVHARSQSHDYRVTTVCAWCHAPTTEGATQDSMAAVPIEAGTWEGVTCGACHPGRLEASMRESLLTNYLPGSNPIDPASYVFIDRSDPVQYNAQCQYCHHEFHDILSPAKAEMLQSGMLRCIDCHMAGYAVSGDQVVERFHNMKVEANGPLSCSGKAGTDLGCHANATTDWVRTNIPNIKGPRKEW